MQQSFDPLNLTEEASLNSLDLGDLPGADPSWVGRRAFEVLSLHALEALGLPASASRTDACELPTSAAAPFGRRLGHLIASLTVEPGMGRSAHGWRRAFLDYWLGLDGVWLAGGIVAGLGSDLLPAVRAEAARLGSRVRISVAPHAGVLALIGAARTWPSEWRCAAVLDCGHTAVKRAVGLADEHGLRQLLLLPPCSTAELGDDPAPEMLASFVAECISQTLQAAADQGVPDQVVRVSIASYIRGGQPISPRGIYGRLPVQQLAKEVQDRTGQALEVRPGHDGTLAAAGLRAPGHSAIIVVGTYLGSGFPPRPDALLPLAPDFNVQDA